MFDSGDPAGGFCNCLWLFCLTEGFSFPGYFSVPPALHPGLSDLWSSPTSLSYTFVIFCCLFLQGFFVTDLFDFIASAVFWVGVLNPQVFFALLFPDILVHSWLRCNKKDPIWDLSQPTSEHSKNVQKTFSFEHSENLQSWFSWGTPKSIQFWTFFEGSDMHVQCIYILTPENTKILVYLLIIISVAFAA